MSGLFNPAVVLLSGGLDSSVLLHHVAHDLNRRPVYAISYDYGQRHARELECARWQAEAAGAAQHRIIDMTCLGPMLKGGTALVEGGSEIPDLDTLDDAQRAQPPTYVPNRNMMLLAIAAAYAEAQGVQEVFYGAQAQDEYGYWDCTTDFVTRLNHTLALNRERPVRIQAPFVETSKAGIVRRGVELGVAFARTWSCYRGAARACGRCPTCVERLHAFEEAGIADPLPYE
ncbi:MAG: 7-cyano-7-deazaguanine synthase QueC [Nitrospiraceae bacterium]|nr:7-cyano-7-deazaguanine synthase QueC [Nitrospiraceae bacterium]